MASRFLMQTSDLTYTYSTFAEFVSWDWETNNKKSTTQGNLIKVQKGETRVKAKVRIADNYTRLENTIFKMETHPFPVTVSFTQNIPRVGNDSAVFEITGLSPSKDISENEMEIKIDLTQVIQ